MRVRARPQRQRSTCRCQSDLPIYRRGPSWMWFAGRPRRCGRRRRRRCGSLCSSRTVGARSPSSRWRRGCGRSWRRPRRVPVGPYRHESIRLAMLGHTQLGHKLELTRIKKIKKKQHHQPHPPHRPPKGKVVVAAGPHGGLGAARRVHDSGDADRQPGSGDDRAAAVHHARELGRRGQCFDPRHVPVLGPHTGRRRARDLGPTCAVGSERHGGGGRGGVGGGKGGCGGGQSRFFRFCCSCCCCSSICGSPSAIRCFLCCCCRRGRARCAKLASDTPIDCIAGCSRDTFTVDDRSIATGRRGTSCSSRLNRSNPVHRCRRSA
ncbi:hypothetical protein BC828DRAFT_145954 [Blastocladiella britannica]|nr:hypothetical protein BC828DRAFT_145954 [Blastocladiella britannica]